MRTTNELGLKHRKIGAWGAALLAMALVATACGGSTTGSADQTSATAAETTLAAPSTVQPSTTELPEPSQPTTPAETTTTLQSTSTSTSAAIDTDDPVTTEPDTGDSSEEDPSEELPLLERLEQDTVLVPGTEYKSLALGPEYMFSPEEELRLSVGNRGLVFLHHKDWPPLPDGIAALFTVVGIQSPEVAGIHASHDPIIPQGTLPLPVDFGEWIETMPQAKLLATGSFEAPAGTVSWWDVTVDPTAGDTFLCPFGDECIGTFVSRELGVFVVSADLLFRIYQIDSIPGFIGWAQSKSPNVFQTATEVIDAVMGGISELAQ